jgi:hypothetical protein
VTTEPRSESARQRQVNRSLAALVAAVSLLTGCLGTTGPPPAQALPAPTCGGIKILIEGALPCDDVAAIAIGALRERAPEQLARGVVQIDVVLATCPANEVPPQIACGREPFAQLVRVAFGPAPPGGPMEPSLTVAVAPVSGAVLGIANPLIR